MGLIAKFTGVEEVFQFISQFFEILPFAIRSLIFISFGGIILICVLRSLWR